MDGMTDRIRIIPHAPAGIPDCGSFEVWFADGRESQWFCWDDNRTRSRRASYTRSSRFSGRGTKLRITDVKSCSCK
jgi:hypothetical protein